MNEIIQQFGRAFLYWDGEHVSGLAMTLWLLVISVTFGPSDVWNSFEQDFIITQAQ